MVKDNVSRRVDGKNRDIFDTNTSLETANLGFCSKVKVLRPAIISRLLLMHMSPVIDSDVVLAADHLPSICAAAVAWKTKMKTTA